MVRRATLLLCVIYNAGAIVTNNGYYNPYSTVDARVTSNGMVDATRAELSKRYLIGTFPNLRQVAYLHLPDNVWRPLVIGVLGSPKGVAVDGQNARLFVADPPNNVIWWYHLGVRPNGMLETVGDRHAAVEGYSTNWIACNGRGDLYFTGRKTGGNATGALDAIFRQDAMNVATGNSLQPTELFTQANTGSKQLAFKPSGIAVDAFDVFWGNAEKGTEHGAIVRGSQRQHMGPVASELGVTEMNNALDEVRGIATTGNHVFFLSQDGVYGLPKTSQVAISNKTVGLIAERPGSAADSSTDKWNPTSIAWDGGNLLYVTDTEQGTVYMLPAINTAKHNLTRFVDAPGVHAISVVGFNSGTQRFHGSVSSFLLLTAVSLIMFYVSS